MAHFLAMDACNCDTVLCNNICDHQEMFVYLFTDDLHPEVLMHYYQNTLKELPHIHFDCRREGNNPFSNVLEDFYSIQKFDCLISPQDARFHEGKIYIDTLDITSQTP